MKSTVLKLIYLEKLLNILLLLSRRYNSVEIDYDKSVIWIRWFNPKSKNWYTFETIEFPITDLNDRILHYRNKLKYNFSKRNLNKK